MSNRKWVDCSKCGTTGEIEVWDEEAEELKLVACPTCGGAGGWEEDDTKNKA